MKYIVDSAIHQGKREYQEDYKIIDLDCAGGKLFIVCDGLGGEGDGDFASEECSRIFHENFPVCMANREPGEDIISVLHRCLSATNSIFKMRINEENKVFSSSTTMIVAFIINDRLFYVSIGDSLLFVIDQKTRKVLTQNLKHESGGYITSCMGLIQFADVCADSLDLKEDFVVILASDGLEFLLDRSKPITELIEDDPPECTAQYLVDETINLQHAHQDNITVISIFCQK